MNCHQQGSFFPGFLPDPSRATQVVALCVVIATCCTVADPGMAQSLDSLRAQADATLADVDAVKIEMITTMDLKGLVLPITIQCEALAPAYTRTHYDVPMMKSTIVVDGEATYTVFRDRGTYMVSNSLPAPSGHDVDLDAMMKGALAMTVDEAVEMLRPRSGTVVEDLGLEDHVLASGSVVPCRLLRVVETLTDEQVPEGVEVAIESVKVWIGRDDGLLYRTVQTMSLDQGGTVMSATIDGRVEDLDLAPELRPEDFVFVPESSWNRVDMGKQFVSDSREGEVFPSVSLQTLDGRSVTWADYADQVVIVSFWATWCAPCRVELAELQEAVHAGQLDVPILAVSSESASTVRRFLQDNPLALTVLLDPDSAASGALGVVNLPSLFVVGAAGRITDHFVGRVSIDLIQTAVADALQREAPTADR